MALSTGGVFWIWKKGIPKKVRIKPAGDVVSALVTDQDIEEFWLQLQHNIRGGRPSDDILRSMLSDIKKVRSDGIHAVREYCNQRNCWERGPNMSHEEAVEAITQ